MATSWLIPTGFHWAVPPALLMPCVPLWGWLSPALWSPERSGAPEAVSNWSQLLSPLSVLTSAKFPSDVAAQQLELPGSNNVLSFYKKRENCNSEGNVMIGDATLTAGPLNVIYMNASSCSSIRCAVSELQFMVLTLSNSIFLWQRKDLWACLSSTSPVLSGFPHSVL